MLNLNCTPNRRKVVHRPRTAQQSRTQAFQGRPLRISRPARCALQARGVALPVLILQIHVREGLRCCATKRKFSSFADMLNNSETPLLVDFYATWCGPCVMMANVLEEVAPKIKGKLAVVKIDTERYPDIAARYNVQGLPTLCVFNKGKVVNRFEGFLTGPQLMQSLQTYL